MTTHLDLNEEALSTKLQRAPIFRKKGTITARPAEPGEQIETVLADGTVETVNTAEPGDWVATNPGGERYLIGAEKFASRYETTAEPGMFRAKGLIRAVRNPAGTDISIMAPWGEEMVGGPTCMVVMALGEDITAPTADRYIIGADEFEQTYAAVPTQEFANESPANGDDFGR